MVAINEGLFRHVQALALSLSSAVMAPDTNVTAISTTPINELPKQVDQFNYFSVFRKCVQLYLDVFF